MDLPGLVGDMRFRDTCCDPPVECHVDILLLRGIFKCCCVCVCVCVCGCIYMRLFSDHPNGSEVRSM